MEAFEVNGEVFIADNDDIVFGILLADELDFSERHIVLSVDEKDLCPLLAIDSECQLHVESSLFYLFEEFLLRLACTLISLDHHCLPIQSLQVRLVFDEVLNACLIITDQNGVILLHHIVSHLREARTLKDIVDVDLVENMIVLSDEDDKRDEEIDDYDQGDDCHP